MLDWAHDMDYSANAKDGQGRKSDLRSRQLRIGSKIEVVRTRIRRSKMGTDSGCVAYLESGSLPFEYEACVSTDARQNPQA